MCIVYKTFKFIFKIGSTFICILFYCNDNELFHTNFANALDLNTSMIQAHKMKNYKLQNYKLN